VPWPTSSRPTSLPNRSTVGGNSIPRLYWHLSPLVRPAFAFLRLRACTATW
jgi:hypothetical protein